MTYEDKRARDIARLEMAQRRTQQRLEQQRDRLDKRFQKMRQRLDAKYGVVSDSQRQIIDAGLELLKEGGLANLTQRKLAQMVDMRAPALYWHFKSKEVMVDYLAEAILMKEFADLQPRRTSEDWQTWLVNHMQRLRKAMLQYPDGARVVAGAHLYPAVTLARSMETCLASLTSASLELHRAWQIVITATTYTFGFVIEEQAAPTAEEIDQFDIGTFLEPFPLMAQMVNDDDHSQAGQDREYLAGLQLIIANDALANDSATV